MRGGFGIFRKAGDTQRQFAGRFSLRSAEDLVDEVPDGAGCWVVTAGQFNFGDWLRAWLFRERLRADSADTVGDVRQILVACWAMGAEGVDALREVGEEVGGKNPIRLMIDPHQAQSAYNKHLQAFADTFGTGSVRLVSSHLKAAVFAGSDLILASSANFTSAPRSEWMLAIRDRGQVEALEAFWDVIWQEIPEWQRDDVRSNEVSQQLAIIREYAEKADLPAGEVVRVSDAKRGHAPESPEGSFGPSAGEPSEGEAEVVEPEDLVRQPVRAMLADLRRAIRYKMRRVNRRTIGEIRAAAAALKDLEAVDVEIGGVDLDVARRILEVVEPALALRKRADREEAVRAGVRRIVADYQR